MSTPPPRAALFGVGPSIQHFLRARVRDRKGTLNFGSPKSSSNETKPADPHDAHPVRQSHVRCRQQQWVLTATIITLSFTHTSRSTLRLARPERRPCQDDFSGSNPIGHRSLGRRPPSFQKSRHRLCQTHGVLRISMACSITLPCRQLPHQHRPRQHAHHQRRRNSVC